MGVSIFPEASASTQKTLGLSVLSTNASLTTLPTNKSITAVIIGGGGSSSWIPANGTIGSPGAGGGGSGQVKEVTFVLTSSVTASCTIGSGGAGVSSGEGNNGGATTLLIPNVVSTTALGGVGSHQAYGGGSGGAAGGGGGGGGTGNGSDGMNGSLLGQKVIAKAITQYATYPGASQQINQNSWTFPVSSVTNNSDLVTTPNYVPYLFNLIPGVYIQGTGDYNSTPTTYTPVFVSTAATSVRNNAILLSAVWSGSSTTFPQVGYATQDGYSVLPTTIDLLTRANIKIPGGGGGGGGGNYVSGSGRAGGQGAGSGGAGGSGGYSDGSNNNVRATNGTSGAQPGGGGGGTGGYGYNNLSGPASGPSASGGAGAIYFFWAA